ncbi:glycerate kinase [Fictibacillus arsenicus]|uniref:Glycerate kinase n=1 Tax=Fictibacillus arsenicus TaxID=255247 RepID=A0A1B1Z933_9BACL|nr:glycerate kinase [Fictibacillus arsenicus]ANX13953.1 glycerate kinase [Fictibacillus arsenicus]
MKIVIAPDSFKESMTAMEVCYHVEKGFRKVFPNANYLKIPIADGGEGTVQAIIDATDGKLIKKKVTGPLGSLVEAFYGITGDEKTAVIEMAAASGLHHIPREHRNPLLTSTRGTGELILDALNHGVERIVLGLGGSATNDGGTGMASALGIAFYDENGEELLMQGDSLNQIRSMDVTGLDHRLKHMRIEAACDVTNPLVGHLGASAVFGPQKGATPEMVAYLDMGLNQLGDVIQEFMNLNVKNIPGAGAAGGLGAGVIAFLNGRLKNGIETVLDIVNFESVSQDADLVITGEGRIDSQTIQGKAPIGVAKRAKQYNIPVIGLAGSLGIGYERIYEYGIDAVFSIVNGVSTLDEALLHAKENVEITSENIARSLKLKKF